MRLFIAVAAAGGFLQEALMTQARLKQSGMRASWTKPEQFHLTLHFLGETDPARLPDIRAALDAAAKTESFELACGRIGFFPEYGEPRVVWLGVQQPARLARLRDRIGAELASRGLYADSRPFAAHLTLGRIARAGGTQKLPDEANAPAPRAGKPAMRVMRAALYESLRSGSGTEHKELYGAALKRSGIP
ncbi:MAG: RNA 2',3'-cyclic phosphodiesterase [Elusimicrobiaceae bacterium]|nr:RNA 2',3'-cyclic phosphodiesterase [Elusimicrobiaceae bacterium]